MDATDTTKAEHARQAALRAIRELDDASSACEQAAFELRAVSGQLTLAEQIDDDGRIELIISVLRNCRTLAERDGDAFLVADIADAIRHLEAADS